MEVSRDPRGARMLAAVMGFKDGLTQQIVVKDLSRRGLGARATGTPPSVAAYVTIHFGQGRLVTGEVRWVRGSRFGMILDQEIDPADFRRVGDGWDLAERPFPPGHVFEQFKPVGRPYRPGLKVK